MYVRTEKQIEILKYIENSTHKLIKALPLGATHINKNFITSKKECYGKRMVYNQNNFHIYVFISKKLSKKMCAFCRIYTIYTI